MTLLLPLPPPLRPAIRSNGIREGCRRGFISDFALCVPVHIYIYPS